MKCFQQFYGLIFMDQMYTIKSTKFNVPQKILHAQYHVGIMLAPTYHTLNYAGIIDLSLPTNARTY